MNVFSHTLKGLRHSDRYVAWYLGQTFREQTSIHGVSMAHYGAYELLPKNLLPASLPWPYAVLTYFATSATSLSTSRSVAPI